MVRGSVLVFAFVLVFILVVLVIIVILVAFVFVLLGLLALGGRLVVVLFLLGGLLDLGLEDLGLDGLEHRLGQLLHGDLFFVGHGHPGQRQETQGTCKSRPSRESVHRRPRKG